MSMHIQPSPVHKVFQPTTWDEFCNQLRNPDGLQSAGEYLDRQTEGRRKDRMGIMLEAARICHLRDHAATDSDDIFASLQTKISQSKPKFETCEGFLREVIEYIIPDRANTGSGKSRQDTYEVSDVPILLVWDNKTRIEAQLGRLALRKKEGTGWLRPDFQMWSADWDDEFEESLRHACRVNHWNGQGGADEMRNRYDVLWSVTFAEEIDANSLSLRGPSAGAAVALALNCLMDDNDGSRKKTIHLKKFAVSAKIETDDGKLGKVGKLIHKIRELHNHWPLINEVVVSKAQNFSEDSNFQIKEASTFDEVKSIFDRFVDDQQDLDVGEPPVLTRHGMLGHSRHFKQTLSAARMEKEYRGVIVLYAEKGAGKTEFLVDYLRAGSKARPVQFHCGIKTSSDRLFSALANQLRKKWNLSMVSNSDGAQSFLDVSRAVSEKLALQNQSRDAVPPRRECIYIDGIERVEKESAVAFWQVLSSCARLGGIELVMLTSANDYGCRAEDCSDSAVTHLWYDLVSGKRMRIRGNGTVVAARRTPEILKGYLECFEQTEEGETARAFLQRTVHNQQKVLPNSHYLARSLAPKLRQQSRCLHACKIAATIALFALFNLGLYRGDQKAADSKQAGQVLLLSSQLNEFEPAAIANMIVNQCYDGVIQGKKQDIAEGFGYVTHDAKCPKDLSLINRQQGEFPCPGCLKLIQLEEKSERLIDRLPELSICGKNAQYERYKLALFAGFDSFKEAERIAGIEWQRQPASFAWQMRLAVAQGGTRNWRGLLNTLENTQVTEKEAIQPEDQQRFEMIRILLFTAASLHIYDDDKKKNDGYLRKAVSLIEQTELCQLLSLSIDERLWHLADATPDELLMLQSLVIAKARALEKLNEKQNALDLYLMFQQEPWYSNGWFLNEENLTIMTVDLMLSLERYHDVVQLYEQIIKSLMNSELAPSLTGLSQVWRYAEAAYQTAHITGESSMKLAKLVEDYFNSLKAQQKKTSLHVTSKDIIFVNLKIAKLYNSAAWMESAHAPALAHQHLDEAESLLEELRDASPDNDHRWVRSNMYNAAKLRAELHEAGASWKEAMENWEKACKIAQEINDNDADPFTLQNTRLQYHSCKLKIEAIRKWNGEDTNEVSGSLEELEKQIDFSLLEQRERVSLVLSLGRYLGMVLCYDRRLAPQLKHISERVLNDLNCEQINVSYNTESSLLNLALANIRLVNALSLWLNQENKKASEALASSYHQISTELRKNEKAGISSQMMDLLKFNLVIMAQFASTDDIIMKAAYLHSNELIEEWSRTDKFDSRESSTTFYPIDRSMVMLFYIARGHICFAVRDWDGAISSYENARSFFPVNQKNAFFHPTTPIEVLNKLGVALTNKINNDDSTLHERKEILERALARLQEAKIRSDVIDQKVLSEISGGEEIVEQIGRNIENMRTMLKELEAEMKDGDERAEQDINEKDPAQ